MESSYNISLGTGRIELSNGDSTYYGMQVIVDNTLNSDITVKLQQSSNDGSYEDLADTSKTLSSDSSTFIETFDFVLGKLYLYIDVGSATVGNLEVILADKKKEEVSSSSGGGGGTQDVNVINTPLSTTETNPIVNSTNFDAFGRFRVSQVTSQADLKQIYDELPQIFDIEEIGTGSHVYSANSSESTFTTSASSDAVIMQTKQRYNYSSGKSSLILVTFRNFDTETNIKKRIGYFNSNTTSPYTGNFDGIYLENNNGTIRFAICKNGTSNFINQSSWDDRMDGNGSSGVDLELGTNDGNYILWMDYEWLGVGQVRFGFIKDGVYYIAHKVDHILGDGVYMTSPNHSIRAEIRQSGAGGGTFRMICATYGSEGDLNELGKDAGIDDDGTHLDANSTSNWYYAVGLRLQAAKVDTLIDFIGGYVLSKTNDKFLYRLLFNPTYNGTVTYTDITDYSASYGLGTSTNTITDDGYVLSVGGGENNSVASFEFNNALKLGMNIDGTLDEVVLVVKPLTTNLDIHRGMNWKELS